MTYDQLLHNLRNNINFSFSRWGDGEFNCIMQNRPGKANCDGNFYYPGLGTALHEIIKSGPEYYMGMQPLAERLYPEKAAEFKANGSTWINADILHNASMNAGLCGLFEAVTKRQVLYVGAPHLENISIAYRKWFYNIGERNCWERKDEILRSLFLSIDELLFRGFRDGVVVFISAGMAANYFVDELYKKYRTRHTFIDAGSVFDPYCGVNSRKYHTQIIDREHKRSNPVS